MPLKTRAGGKKALDRSCQCLRLCRCLSPASRRTTKLRRAKGKPPKWNFEVWLTQRVEILIAPACLIPLQKRVSWNKDVSINTQGSIWGGMYRAAQSCRSFQHLQTPRRRSEGPGQLCPPHWCHYTQCLLSLIQWGFLSPPSLAHLMCAFRVLLTCDTADLNPMTEPLYLSHKHWTTQSVLTVCIAERWHLNVIEQ